MSVTTANRPRQIHPTYVVVAAGQTNATLATIKGCFLTHIVINPAVVGCGAVTLHDGKGGNSVDVYSFVGGGTSALVDCKPFVVPIMTHCKVTEASESDQGWFITTGANVSVTALVQEA